MTPLLPQLGVENEKIRKNSEKIMEPPTSAAARQKMAKKLNFHSPFKQTLYFDLLGGP